jgi:anti-sigma factor (TIGR02949 family)
MTRPTHWRWPWSPRPYECADALARLDDYLDRRLTPKERTLVEEHLAVCTACTSKYRFETMFVTELRRKLTRIDVPPRLADRVQEALRRPRTP